MCDLTRCQGQVGRVWKRLTDADIEVSGGNGNLAIRVKRVWYQMATRKRLDQILLTKGLVTETKIRAALNRQKTHGGRLGEHLLRSGDIREIELVGALSEQFGVPGICLTGRELDPVLFEMLPRRLAESYHCIPLTYDAPENRLDIAFADPDNAEAVWAISEAIRPVLIRSFVAADAAIHAVLTQSLLPSMSLPIDTGPASGAGAVHPDPIARSIISLVEMAVRAAERTRGAPTCDSVWTARLAEEMAARLGLSNRTTQMIRLTALTAFCAAWQRSVQNEPLSALLGRSQSLLLTLDLPWDLAGLLTESARWNDINVPSPAAQVLRTAFAVGELKPDTPTDRTIEAWQKSVATSVKWNLSPEFVTMAFSIVTEWWQQRQLDDPPREAMIVGASALTETLARNLSAAKQRHLKISSVPEALVLIRRRTPDLVCVHVASETASTYNELTDILGAIPRYSAHVMLIASDTCSARVMNLARDGLAEVIAESAGSATILARIQSILTPQRQISTGTESSNSSSRSTPAGFPSVAGHLADMSLADLVQVLSAAQKTAKVIFRRQGQDAILWFRQGQIVSAQSNGLKGEDAFFDLVKWRDGTFEVHTTDDVPPKNVTSTTPGLLLEGYRRLDEWRRDRDMTPVG